MKSRSTKASQSSVGAAAIRRTAYAVPVAGGHDQINALTRLIDIHLSRPPATNRRSHHPSRLHSFMLGCSGEGLTYRAYSDAPSDAVEPVAPRACRSLVMRSR